MIKDIAGVLLPVLLVICALSAPTEGRAVTTKKPLVACALPSYNRTYPLTAPIKVSNGTKYRIAIISDLDRNSIQGKQLISYLKEGYLTYDAAKKRASIEWDAGKPANLSTDFNAKGRGMELSELIVFNGKLYSMDDKTGILYEVDAKANSMVPWLILTEGNGRSAKGMKTEWATVKDNKLYVGGHLKDETTENGTRVGNGDFTQYVKVISPTGELKHVNWKDNYNRLLKAAKIDPPGYMMHESCVWSPIHKQWFFLPRYSSRQPFNVNSHKKMGTNVFLSANSDFSKIKVTNVGNVVPTRGFSSVKMIPNTGDSVMVALRAEETDDDIQATFITVFTTSGQVILPETKVADDKYEGIEFV